MSEFTKEDLRVMSEVSRDCHGDNEEAYTQGIISLVDYSRLVSNL